MRTMSRQFVLITATVLALLGASLVASPAQAQARWHGGGGWHGGGWHGGGWRGGGYGWRGYGWRGYGWGFGTGVAVGLAAPYYAYPAYGYGYPAYGGCALRARWVATPSGYSARRWVRVCY